MPNMYLLEVWRRQDKEWYRTFIISKPFMKKSQILTYLSRKLPKERANMDVNLFLVSSETCLREETVQSLLEFQLAKSA